MEKKRVLVTYQIPEESMNLLINAGFEVIWPESDKPDWREFEDKIRDCDAVVTVFGIPFPDIMFERAKKLKILSNYGAGVDNINLTLATKKGVVVTNTPDQVTEPTAELTIALMLSLARRVAEMNRKLRDSNCTVKWGVMDNLGMTLQGKRLGIIGMGKIGRATARRALALGMQIVYFNRHRLTEDEEDVLQAKYLPLRELLETTDILSLHTPLTEDTFHLIGEEAFRLMKPSAFLVNTARGAVVDEQALIRALQEKQIAGAALDVFENEPHIPDALLAMDQVVAVPHIGTAAWEIRVEIGKQAARNVVDYFNGSPVRYCVNPEVLERKA